MMTYPALVSGTLLRRYKRFLADVRLDSGGGRGGPLPEYGLDEGGQRTRLPGMALA